MQDFKGFDPLRRTDNGHENGQAPDEGRTNAGQAADETYTFVAIAQDIGVDESTLRRRWWAEKIEPAYRYCPDPLRIAVRTTKAGNPVYEFSPFALQVFREYKAAHELGKVDEFLKAAQAKYPEPETPEVEAEIIDEPGGELAIATPSESTIAITPDQVALSEAREDFEADQEVAGQLITNFAGLLLSHPQALKPVMRQAGRQAGQMLFNEYQQGINEVFQTGMQSHTDTSQGKSENS